MNRVFNMDAVSDKAILFGMGRSIQERPSNIRFQHFVEVFRADYIQSSSNSQRKGLVERVIDALRGDGYTFLKPSVTDDGGEDHSHWVSMNAAEVEDKVSQLFRSGNPADDVNIPPSSTSVVAETTELPSVPPSSVSNVKKRSFDEGAFYSPENYPTKHARVVSDESDMARRWVSTSQSSNPRSLSNGLTRSIMGLRYPPAPALHNLKVGGGLETYNQLPMVIPTPNDKLTVDDLTRPRTIGYIKQPFLPSNPNVVVYRPVVLLPLGSSAPSPFAPALTTDNIKMAAGTNHGIHNAIPLPQFQSPSSVMTSAFLYGLTGQASNDVLLKSGLCRT